MSLVVRKPDFCICENKDADQLRGNREADQRLCFRSTSLIRNFKPLVILCGCTARFVWDLVGKPEDRFSHNEAHVIQLQKLYRKVQLTRLFLNKDTLLHVRGTKVISPTKKEPMHGKEPTCTQDGNTIHRNTPQGTNN